MLLLLALRSLRRHRRRTTLTVLAIASGTAIVVFAWGFGEGLAAWLTRSAVSGRLGAVQVHARGFLDTLDANPIDRDLAIADVLPRVSAVPGVRAAAPRIKLAAIVSTGASSSMVQVEAIDPTLDPRVCPDRFGELRGQTLSSTAGRSVIVGRELATSLNVDVGDTVTLMAATRTGAQNALDFTVVGVTAGAALFESKRVLTTRLVDAAELLGMPGRAHEIAAALDDDADADDVAVALRGALPADACEVHTWQEVSPFMRDAVARIRIVLRGVSAVLFLVVVFGVANTMLMSIFERTREIGTFLALGMRRRAVLALFVLEAVVLGMSGSLVGGTLGAAVVLWLGERGIRFFAPGSSLPAVLYPILSPAVVLGVGVATLIGAVAASFVPARRASRLDPIEALRTP